MAARRKQRLHDGRIGRVFNLTMYFGVLSVLGAGLWIVTGAADGPGRFFLILAALPVAYHLHSTKKRSPFDYGLLQVALASVALGGAIWSAKGFADGITAVIASLAVIQNGLTDIDRARPGFLKRHLDEEEDEDA